MRAVFDRLQRLAARSRLLVRVAVLVRNQARCVIRYHLAESPDTNATGEVWLREFVGAAGTRFIDVGANVGDWIAAVAELKGKSAFEAIALEPSSTALERLRGRFEAESRVEILSAAAADAAGTMAFLEEPDAGRGSTLVPGFAAVRGSMRQVELVTLDELVALRGWQHVDFVKIDAEGYDARVIRGAASLLSRQAIGVVQFEYNRAWQLAGETLYGTMRFLENFGYRVYVLKRDGLFVLDYPRYEEYYEYSNFVALDPTWNVRLTAHMRGTI